MRSSVSLAETLPSASAAESSASIRSVEFRIPDPAPPDTRLFRFDPPPPVLLLFGFSGFCMVETDDDGQVDPDWNSSEISE